eukprot:Hpha_TRINITY_DN15873_c1_g6::TRINITY_DN15873_c1_g6_i1::g.189793::m.189793/K05991/E3.2.1.123; endoglycosylceramidase
MRSLMLMLGVAAGVQLDAIRTSENSPHFYDSHGRVRIFHGCNGVHKGEPWYPGWLLNETLVQEISSWGFNAIRVGWMFSGFEPAEGQFNESYVEKSKEVTQLLAKYGIHSLLDTHQDCMSSKFCTYDGLPLWLVNRSHSLMPYPWPYKGNCSSRGWETNCLTEAADRSYQDLYDNKHGMRDAFVEFWEESAKRWAGDTNILGLELINEPFAGDVYADPTLFLPGEAGKKNLQPLYEAVQEKIRLHDKDHVIFYEPVTWGMIFKGGVAGSGFTQVPGGAAYKNRSAFSFHYYCNSFGGNRVLCDNVLGPQVIHAVQEEIKVLGGASMMTEWGGCDGDNLDECVVVTDIADANLVSWTEYDGFGQTGNFPRDVYIARLSRTYAQAIAGEPSKMFYDNSTQRFELCFDLDASIQAPTEIFVPARHYPAGVVVNATANLVVDSAPDNRGILRARTATGVTGISPACVHLTRK